MIKARNSRDNYMDERVGKERATPFPSCGGRAGDGGKTKTAHLSLALGIAIAVIAPLLIGAPVAHAGPVAPEMTILVEPQTLPPGQAGYVYVGGRYPLDVQVVLDGRPLTAFWAGDGYMTSRLRPARPS